MKKFVMNLAERIMLKILLKTGYPYHTAAVAVKELTEDIMQIKKISLARKIRLYKKGHYSQRLACYGIDKNNPLHFYIPELKYYKLHPVSGIYSKWIDDKLTMRYVFDRYRAYLPEYYFQVLNGRIIKLSDCPGGYESGFEGLAALLREKGILAAKPAAGSRGYGFHKLEYDGEGYAVDGTACSEHAFSSLISGMADYLVTEYLFHYKELMEIYPPVSNPVRVVVVNDENGPRIAAAFIRIMTDSSKHAPGLSPYCVYCGIDLETGELYDPVKYNEHMDIVSSATHPDTGVLIKGRIRNWKLMKEVIQKIGIDFPQLRLVGYDIIFTEDSFRIIEMNSLPGLQHTQRYYPLLKNDEDRGFFKKLFAEKNIRI